MYILYKPTHFCFKTQLEKDLWSPTLIKRHLWKYHYVFTYLVEDTFRQGKDYIQWRFSKHDGLLKHSEIHGKDKTFATSIIDDFVRWKVLKRRRDNKKTHTTRTGFTYEYSTDVHVIFFDDFVQNGFEAWNDTSVVQGPKCLKVNTSYGSLTGGKSFVSPLLTGVFKLLADNLPLVRIDAVEARKYAADALRNRMRLKDKTYKFVVRKNRVVNKLVYSYWMMMIDAIERGDYCPQPDEFKTGRFFSRMTSLPKVLRQFVTINNKQLVEIDISNSQCLIFSIFLQDLYKMNGLTLPTDVVRFIKECETGTFYENAKRLVTVDDETEISYQDFKVQFFSKAFFSSGKREYKWCKHFANYYGNVYKHIKAFKDEQGYKSLPISLQKLESDVMLQQVCASLYKQGINEFYTVHDAIYCPIELKNIVEDTIHAEFVRYGVTPHVKSK